MNWTHLSKKEGSLEPMYTAPVESVENKQPIRSQGIFHSSRLFNIGIIGGPTYIQQFPKLVLKQNLILNFYIFSTLDMNSVRSDSLSLKCKKRTTLLHTRLERYTWLEDLSL